MPKAQQEVATVLGTDVEYEQLLRNFATFYWSLWMVSFPICLYLLYAHTQWGRWGLCGLAYGGLLLLVLAQGRIFFQSELILDHERQELMLRQRRFFFFVSYKPLMGAEDLWGTTWAGELPQAPFTWWWEYVALIVTRQGRRFRALRQIKDIDLVVMRARSLAQQLGIPYHEGKQAHRLSILPGPTLSFRSVPVQGLDLLSLIYWGLLIIPGIVCMVWGLLMPFPSVL